MSYYIMASIYPLQSYFELKLSISADIDVDIRDMYMDAISNHNVVVNRCIYEDLTCEFDAGFDLFCPNDEYILDGMLGYKINHKIKCCMNKISVVNNEYVSKPVGYYLYPRSSTGTKTPLRLSNSVGIIDSGYRGNIIAAFDNKNNPSSESWSVTKGMRVVQICPPDLSYPILVKVVSDDTELGITSRGSGGFGSTDILNIIL